MKNLYKGLIALTAVFTLNACSDSDNVIDKVFDNVENGAVLRTISVNSQTLNSSDPSSSFSVTVEEQDVEDGALLESVDVFVSIRDLSPGNGTTTANDMLVKTIDASAFSAGPLGLPRTTVEVTFAEAEAAMGLNASQHAPGDLFVFELRLNLTDGRTFGAADAGGIITGGFFSSPYKYNAAIVCSPKPGDYVIDMHDTYGDGWQTNGGNGGDGISITITDAAGNETVEYVGMCTPYGDGSWLDTGNCSGPASTSFYDASATVTIPAGTATAIWEFPGDQYGEISFEIYAPDGTLLLEVGVGEGTPGLLPVTNCL